MGLKTVIEHTEGLLIVAKNEQARGEDREQTIYELRNVLYILYGEARGLPAPLPPPPRRAERPNTDLRKPPMNPLRRGGR